SLVSDFDGLTPVRHTVRAAAVWSCVMLTEATLGGVRPIGFRWGPQMQTDYGVELGAPPDMSRLQVRLVGSARPLRNVQRDRLAAEAILSLSASVVTRQCFNRVALWLRCRSRAAMTARTASSKGGGHERQSFQAGYVCQAKWQSLCRNCVGR